MAVDDFFVIKEDAIRTPIAALINDDVAPGVTIVSASGASNGVVEIIDGVIHYSPSADYVGEDSFTYTLSDGESATVNINVVQSHEQPQYDVDNWREELIDTPEERALLQAQLDDMAPEITPSGLNLVVSRYAKLPGEPAMDAMTHRDGNMYVLAQATTGSFADNDGKIFEIARDPVTGETSVSEFLDVGQLILDLPEAVGLNITLDGGIGDGPRSIAFHPDFDNPGTAGYGKLYISMVATADPNMDPADFLSTPTIGNGATLHNVTFEVTYDFETETFPAETYREVIRDQPTVRQHPVRDIGFDPYAEPGDEDYGLLYIIHGDGEPNSAAVSRDAGQLNNGSGKLLRIDPLQNGDEAYTVPASNPFVGDPDMLDEVFALGLRNEHTMSFAIDPATGDSVVVLTGIGFTNIDEVNIVRAGDNLGWAYREGHFITLQDDGVVTSLSPLPENEWELGLTYPVSFVAHDGPIGAGGDLGQALSGGHIISNGSELDGQLIFADFSSSSRAYHISATDMFAAKTQLEPGEDPSELSWVTPNEAVILFNHDNDPSTTPIALGSFHDLVGNPSRSDVRFGEGGEGELYIMNKHDGWIYIVENSTPEGFALPTGFPLPGSGEDVFNAESDAYVIDADLDVLNIFAFGGARGVIENDNNPGLEPVITAVNGETFTFLNGDTQLEAAVDGSNGGIFTLARNGQMSFTPGDDFADLAPGEARVSSVRYTLENEFGEVDEAEVFVTVRGDTNLQLEVDFVSGFDQSTGVLVPNSSMAYTATNWTVIDAPTALVGSTTIPLYNNDNALSLSGVVRSFTLNADGYVYVGFDADQNVLPAWLADEAWVATNEVLEISNGNEVQQLAIYGRKYGAGELVEIFGPDDASTGASLNSIIMVSDAAIFEADEGTISYGGKEYVIAGRGQSWAEAQATAAALGGTLLQPEDADENAFVVETFGTKGPIWLDLSDAANEGTWINSDGEAAAYTNWLPGSPSNAGGSQHYARIANADGRWDDGSLNSSGILVGNQYTPRETLTIVEIPEDDAVLSFGDSTYQLGTAGLTWQEAQAEAEALGGRLLEVDSAAENAFIVNNFWDDNPIWLGWSDLANEGQYVGIDGAVGYTNWSPGNPDNAGAGQDYARIVNAQGVWDDGFNGSTGVLVNGAWSPTGTTTTIIEFDNAPPAAIAQGGMVTTDQANGGQWHTVTFAEQMDNPIVVMGPITNNGAQPAFTRVRDVTSDGFEFQIDEWAYQDGYHVTETISWMAVEAGTHNLGGGLVIEAGSVIANTVQDSQTFAANFSDAPAIFGQVASDFGGDPVVARIDDVTADGFDFLFQEEEASYLAPLNAPVSANGFGSYEEFNALFPTMDDREFGVHVDEEFHFVAMSEGGYGPLFVGSSDGIQSATHVPFDVNYDAQSFTPDGLLLQTTSMDAYNPATGRLVSLGATSAEVFIQEDASYDPETQRLFGDSYSWAVMPDQFVLYDDLSFA